MNPSLRRSRRRQSGQILPIAAAGFLVLAAIAGLAIDASRDYLVKRDAQNAVDFAALAAAKEMTLSGNVSAALSTGSAPVVAAHDFAANNGFPTNYNTTCDSTVGGGFTTSWFDVGGLACSATSGFTNKVTVNSPAVALPGAPVPPVCVGAGQFACVQVVITTSVAELFTSVLGVKSVYITVGASAHATLPGSSVNAPWPAALVLYETQLGCVASATTQCFNESKPVARASMNCTTGTNNCPTFWAANGTTPLINGYDGQYMNTPTDITAIQSNGDLVLQSQTTFCDPYGGNAANCQSTKIVGAKGYGVPAGSNVYCSKYGAGATIITPCTTTGQSGLSELDSNQASWTAAAYWQPAVDTSKLTGCGSLVLNGQAVYGACANAVEPYLIEPGIYSYIVINHGTYEFDSGLYDITGVAPVNTAGSGTANGIDHSNETTAADFDLCNAGGSVVTGNACAVTAGVWFGHGSLNYSAYVAPSSGTCAGGGSGGANGGGGDQTIIGGNAVVFRLESSSGGFVSTNEVTTVNMAGAGVNSLASVGGSPLLIDEENNSFIHLDASPPSGGGGGGGGGGSSLGNQFQGIIYQTSSATAGGVEVNLGIDKASGGHGGGGGGGGGATPAVLGQVLAYSFTTFGKPGTLDFSQGYGTGTVPGIQTSGKNETSIILSTTLTPAATSGYETLTVVYTDEWYMDAYDQFIKVNNGSPQFFSQGIWKTVPTAGAILPPVPNNPGPGPGDSPLASEIYPYQGATGGPNGNYVVNSMSSVYPSAADWTWNIPNSNNSTIEVSGQWTWGHEKDLAPPVGPAQNTPGDIATVKYTFPTPSGTYVSVSVFVSDGDRCGDYAYSAYTFKNSGAPGPGQQTVGAVDLAQ